MYVGLGVIELNQIRSQGCCVYLVRQCIVESVYWSNNNATRRFQTIKTAKLLLKIAQKPLQLHCLSAIGIPAAKYAYES